MDGENVLSKKNKTEDRRERKREREKRGRFKSR